MVLHRLYCSGVVLTILMLFCCSGSPMQQNFKGAKNIKLRRSIADECDAATQFPCGIFCAPIHWKCDGLADCRDGIDEINCPKDEPSKTTASTQPTIIGTTPNLEGEDENNNEISYSTTDQPSLTTIDINEKSCKETQFKCKKNGICIPTAWLCDEDADCIDGSDEENCTNNYSHLEKSCKETEFKCKKHGVCIPTIWLCDEDPDCSDASDETNCTNYDSHLEPSKTTASTQPTIIETTPHLEGEDAYNNEISDSTTDQPHLTTIEMNGEFETQTEVVDPTDETMTTDVPCNETWLFTCKSDGSCITNEWWCDGDMDCADNSDEENCTETSCNTNENQFKCTDGMCVPKTWLCDGDHDCPDKSDEENCEEKSCKSTEFKCKSGIHCIPIRWLCDGDVDCPDDKSDEENCEIKVLSTTVSPCGTNKFMCASDEKCLPASLRCNRIADCSDHSDEINCGTRECTEEEDVCEKTGYCIFKSWKCDGQNDCVDNSDEIDCQGCLYHQFTCPNGLCIDKSSICDSLMDCPDGSDELNCSEIHSPLPCRSGFFPCQSDNSCISNRLRCNTISDCTDNSDEEDCNKESCQPNEIRCHKSGYCLPKHLACNGYADCLDGTDEVNCTTTVSGIDYKAVTTFPASLSRPDSNPNCIRQCPEGFQKMGGKCILVHVFPRRWLRAKQLCHSLGGQLLVVDTINNDLNNLTKFLATLSLKGWNYWVDIPKLQVLTVTNERNVVIPSWFANGRACDAGSAYPMYHDHCYFLHYKDSLISKGTNCNDNAGFICEII